MVETITEIQENEMHRPFIPLKYIHKSNEFTQSQTNKLTDPNTYRTRSNQQSFTQNTKDRHTILSEKHLHERNQGDPLPILHLPEIPRCKIHPLTHHWQKIIHNAQTLRQREHNTSHTHTLTHLDNIGRFKHIFGEIAPDWERQTSRKRTAPCPLAAVGKDPIIQKPNRTPHHSKSLPESCQDFGIVTEMDE